MHACMLRTCIRYHCSDSRLLTKLIACLPYQSDLSVFIHHAVSGFVTTTVSTCVQSNTLTVFVIRELGISTLPTLHLACTLHLDTFIVDSTVISMTQYSTEYTYNYGVHILLIHQSITKFLHLCGAEHMPDCEILLTFTPSS